MQMSWTLVGLSSPKMYISKHSWVKGMKQKRLKLREWAFRLSKAPKARSPKAKHREAIEICMSWRLADQLSARLYSCW